MSRMQGPVDKNGLHKHIWKKPAAGGSRRGKDGGRLRFHITLPDYLSEAIQKEAAEKRQSFNATAVNWLEAAYALSEGE